MALIGRFFAIFFGFLVACIVASAVVLYALFFPEMNDVSFDVDQGAINVILGFGFLLVSGFALLPAAIIALVTEAFRSGTFWPMPSRAASRGCSAISASFRSTP